MCVYVCVSSMVNGLPFSRLTSVVVFLVVPFESLRAPYVFNLFYTVRSLCRSCAIKFYSFMETLSGDKNIHSPPYYIIYC